VSPDGRHVAFGVDDGKEQMVWIYDLSGATSMRRLTFGGRNRYPAWSADSARVAFSSDRDGDAAIFWQRADGTGTAERLTKPEQGTSHVPNAWSPDGKTLFFSVTKGSDVSLWTLSVQEKKVAAFGGVQATVQPNPAISPTGAGSCISPPVSYSLSLFLQTGRSTKLRRRPAVIPAVVARRQEPVLHSCRDSSRHSHHDFADVSRSQPTSCRRQVRGGGPTRSRTMT
jgi:WD40 repeat protein